MRRAVQDESRITSEAATLADPRDAIINLKLLTLLMAITVVTACIVQPDAPPQILASAYGGIGDRVGKCIQYASESTCIRQSWGSDEQE